MEGTVMIALGMVMGLILFITIAGIRTRRSLLKKRLEILEAFDNIVTDNDLQISRKEVLGNKILALDETKKTLVVVQKGDEVKYDIIQLAMIRDCYVKRVGIKIRDRKRNGQLRVEEDINEIYLSLVLANKLTIDIPMYSEREDGLMEMIALAGVAERWQSLIKRELIKDTDRTLVLMTRQV